MDGELAGWAGGAGGWRLTLVALGPSSGSGPRNGDPPALLLACALTPESPFALDIFSLCCVAVLPCCPVSLRPLELTMSLKHIS